MASITFDTLKFVDTLEQAQLPRDQARAIAVAVRDSHNAADLVTKKDLEIALASVHNEITDVRGELKLQRALLGAVLGGIIAILVRLFF